MKIPQTGRGYGRVVLSPAAVRWVVSRARLLGIPPLAALLQPKEELRSFAAVRMKGAVLECCYRREARIVQASTAAGGSLPASGNGIFCLVYLPALLISARNPDSRASYHCFSSDRTAGFVRVAPQEVPAALTLDHDLRQWGSSLSARSVRRSPTTAGLFDLLRDLGFVRCSTLPLSERHELWEGLGFVGVHAVLSTRPREEIWLGKMNPRDLQCRERQNLCTN